MKLRSYVLADVQGCSKRHDEFCSLYLRCLRSYCIMSWMLLDPTGSVAGKTAQHRFEFHPMHQTQPHHGRQVIWRWTYPQSTAMFRYASWIRVSAQQPFVSLLRAAIIVRSKDVVQSSFTAATERVSSNDWRCVSRPCGSLPTTLCMCWKVKC